MSSGGSRIRAGLALLALYVLGAAWGVPVLDAVLYHTVDAGGPAGPHLEPDGGCGHADGCFLGVGTPRSPPAQGQLAAARFAPSLRAAPPASPTSFPAVSPRSSQHSRAPPVHFS